MDTVFVLFGHGVKWWGGTKAVGLSHAKERTSKENRKNHEFPTYRYVNVKNRQRPNCMGIASF